MQYYVFKSLSTKSTFVMKLTSTIFTISMLAVWPILLFAHDTLYICQPGETIQLEVSPFYVGYSWTPSASLDNPTIFNPVASPNTSTTYIVESITAFGLNLLVNPNFSDGNTGFSSAYPFVTTINTQGVYGVGPDPSAFNSVFFSPCEDHTGGNGNMMVIDGFPQANVEVWCQEVAVLPNTEYGFSTWVTSIFDPNPAQLQFSINGSQLGAIFSAGDEVCQWRQFYETWNSGNASTAEICIINQNTDPNGNDFALDDFAFFELGEIVMDTITVIVENTEVTVIDTAICEGMSIEFQGTQIGANTSETFVLSSINGCDSTIIYNVGILDTIYEFFTIDTLCPGEILDFLGNTISTDTVICTTIPLSATCDSTYCITVSYLTESAIALDTQQPSCNGFSDGSLSAEVQAGLPPYSFNWSNGINTSEISDLSAGSYTLTVTDSKACQAISTIELGEPGPLIPNITSDSQICNEEENGVLFLNAEGGTPNYEYSIDGGQQFVLIPSIQNLRIDTYEVLVQDANGCEAVQQVEIPQPEVVSLFVPQLSTFQLGDTQYASISDNASTTLSYQWMPEDGLTCPTCPSTIIQPLRNTTYTITAVDEFGCSVEATLSVQVNRKLNVYIPNAFSPNGDQINDTFEIFVGQGVTAIRTLQIFDRWGNHLFNSSLESNFAWDGQFRGEPAAQGIYTYFTEVEYLDGSSMRFEGEVVLVR